MQYKISVNLNRIPDEYNILADFELARQYHLKHGVDITFVFKTISVEGYASVYSVASKRWLINNSQNLCVIDPTADANMFVFDQNEWATPQGSKFPLQPNTPNGNCFIFNGKPFMNVGAYIADHNDGQTWIQIAHEIMHSYTQNASLSGFSVVDIMDTYFHNDNPDFPTGNFAQQWNLLSLFLLNYKNAIILGMRVLKAGMTGQDVSDLQRKLKNLGYFPSSQDITQYFGNITLTAVKSFQSATGLVSDGMAGALTIAKINSLSAEVNTTSLGTKMVTWIEAIKEMEGALPERNNPGNLRYVGQQFAVNDGGFCKFDTYQHGYDALSGLLIRACTGKIDPPYNPNGNLYDFYNVYAPSSDGNNPKHYAEFVASKIGVPPTTIISTLI